jgi:CheY-like chemotaxis protein
MDIKTVMLTKQEFIKQLRHDLIYLYDPYHLQRSPFVGLFDITSQPDPFSVLHNILTKTVESLKPADDAPYSHAWEIYEPLFYRYIEQLSPQEVADQLAISPRQLRRKQRDALIVLADIFWKQYHIGEKLGQNEGNEIIHEQSRRNSTSIDKELAWLKDSSQISSVKMDEIIPILQKITQKLVDQHAVHLNIVMPEDLPYLLIHPVALRQILLNILSVAVPHASGGEVCILIKPLRRDVQIQIKTRKSPPCLKPIQNGDSSNLITAQRLAKLTGYRLLLSTNAAAFNAVLTIATREEIHVLVIDDNTDTLQMLKRYTVGTRYHLLTTHDPNTVLDLANKYSPEIIVLDIMMPQMDGWQVLEQLRQNHATSNARIIVCSILGQSDFAIFMGADAALSKPVTPQAFLAALDQQAVLMEKGSR